MPPQAHKKGPTLIVVEVSCLSQWKEKLIEFGGIKPMMVTSTSAMVKIDDNVDVVLTTYSVFQQAKRAAAKSTKKSKKDDGKTEDNAFQLPPALNRHWWRIILDEAHKIRNSKTLLFRALSSITADIKW